MKSEIVQADSHKLVNATELFAGIGKIVVRFQQIEMWVSEILAGMLLMRNKDDRYLVSSAMSFRQKVDLLVELYPKRRPKMVHDIDIKLVRRALYTAEEFRNRIVHSFWAIECGERTRWVRIKASLRGRLGFTLRSVDANTLMLEECAGALKTICEWVLATPAEVEAAIGVIDRHMQPELKDVADNTKPQPG